MSLSEQERHPIQVVVRRTGLSADVLRAWEKRYGVVAPRRAAGGRRMYSDEDVERLRLLKQVTSVGRAVSQVAGLSDDQLAALAREDQAEEGRVPRPGPDLGATPTAPYLEAARQAVRELDSAGLETVLSIAMAALPADRAMTELVVPLMWWIGDEWSGGGLTIAHEHMASAVTRQVLGVVLAYPQVRIDAPVLVAATPAGERHEFGAMMVAATGVTEGWRVLYLGADLPADAIAVAARRERARAVALSVVSSMGAERAVSEVSALRAALPDEVSVFVGGGAAGMIAPLEKRGVVVLPDLDALRNALRSPAGTLRA